MIEGLRFFPSISAQEFGAFIQRGASCRVNREAPKIPSEPLIEIGESTVYVRGGLVRWTTYTPASTITAR